MPQRNMSAESVGLVTRDCVTETIRRQLRNAVIVERRFTVEQIANESGVSLRAVRTYMANDPSEVREPCLSAALSIAVVLGSRSVNAILALIGYVATPLEEGERVQPMQLVAEAMSDLSAIAAAAVDNRFDHIELPTVQNAADHMIEILTPISSRGAA